MKIRWSGNLIVRYIGFALGFFLLSGIHLAAQTSNGTILGNVEDSSGAAVANAEVTVTNQDTGVARSTVSTAFDIRTGVNESRALNYGNGNSHPDLVAGCTPQNMVNKGNVVNYFKLSCLSVPALGYLGDLPPLYLTGPALVNTDMGLKKVFAMGESRSLQLGVDMFNAFNRTNFSVPTSTTAFLNVGSTAAPNFVPNTTAGQITSTVTTSRQIQIGAKFVF